MVKKYAKPFAQGAYDVLKEMLDGPVTPGKPIMKRTPVPMNGVVVIIGLIGDVEGRFILDMTEESAKRIAGAMNYEEMETFNSLAQATINELANIIVGKAITKLNDDGARFNITPPVLLCGKEMKSTDNALDTIIIPLKTNHGDLNVNIALKLKN